MADAASAERLILKILSGVQIGAEVSLPPGEYLLGSGPDDDIQFIDVSVKPGHARLRIAAGKIEVRAEAGPLSIAEGVRLTPEHANWQEIPPLDIIQAGTLRFAVGLPTAQWSTIADEDISGKAAAATNRPDEPASTRSEPTTRFAKVFLHAKSFIIPIATAVGLIVFTVWLATGGRFGIGPQEHNSQQDFETVRTALDHFPFGKPIELRQEVDGALFASGFVESAVERRALLGAVEKTGVPVHMRVEVLAFLRGEIENLIKAEKVSVTFSLSPTGDLTLEGVILAEQAANQFVALIRDRIIGLKNIDSKIRTAKALLDEIERLAHASQIDQRVIFRVEQTVVEANGVVPSNKIDAWVGFLQAYLRHFGKDIGLRSFVQLQYDPRQPLNQALPNSFGRPIVIGGEDGASNASLDADNLLRGVYKLSDLFAGVVGDLQSADALAASLLANGRTFPPGQQTRSGQHGENGSVVAVGAQRLGRYEQSSEGASNADNPRNSDAEARAANAAKSLRANGGSTASGSDPGGFLLAEPMDDSNANDRCRPGSRLTEANIPAALAHLDELSASNKTSLAALDPETQRTVLEAALNPTLTAKCLERRPDAAQIIRSSTYLHEASRNPDFVQVVTRHVPTFNLNVGGASLGDRRYILTKDGTKIFEGAAPDLTSRLENVGELGLLMRAASGYSRVIYGRNVNWLQRR